MRVNHATKSELKLSEVKATWTLSVIDFASDKNGILEKFTAMFETQEETIKFREVLEKAHSSRHPTFQQSDEYKLTTSFGSWSCDLCYVKNKAVATICITCDTIKAEPVQCASLLTSLNMRANERKRKKVSKSTTSDRILKRLKSCGTPSTKSLNIALNPRTSSAANLANAKRTSPRSTPTNPALSIPALESGLQPPGKRAAGTDTGYRSFRDTDVPILTKYLSDSKASATTMEQFIAHLKRTNPGENGKKIIVK